MAVIFAAAFLVCSSMTVSASEASVSSNDEANEPIVKTAQKVSLTVKDSKGNSFSKFTDDNYNTKSKVSKENTYTIKGKSEFVGIYIVFDKPCEWKVTLPDGTELTGGENGFIHEYMPLGQAVSNITLTLPKDAVWCDIYALSEGALPSWVQIWEPSCEEADLMLVPTHADDEYLWFGGAMPYYAGELGYNVQVVYMTDHVSQPFRSHERLNGLWTVGINKYPVIGEFEDLYSTKASLKAAEKAFGLSEVIRWHVEQIRRFKPKVIIGHDINGEYGHGAHQLNTKALLEAVKISNDPESYPQSAEKYGAYEVQKCYIHLWEENKTQRKF
jgi:LmbE family N-acetylglucosaminyl deacetylase